MPAAALFGVQYTPVRQQFPDNKTSDITHLEEHSISKIRRLRLKNVKKKMQNTSLGKKVSGAVKYTTATQMLRFDCFTVKIGLRMNFCKLFDKALRRFKCLYVSND